MIIDAQHLAVRYSSQTFESSSGSVSGLSTGVMSFRLLSAEKNECGGKPEQSSDE